MTHTIAHFIQGAVTPGQSTREQAVTNPATGAVTGQVRLANGADVQAAVKSAQDAFPAWANTPAPERAKLIVSESRMARAARNVK